MSSDTILPETAGRFTVVRLLTDKAAPGRTRRDVREETAGVDAGEILLRLNRFALTTNNITYAAFGEAMHYWDFFPTGEAGWGLMPVWGFADVVATAVGGIEVGERFYGYFPIASHLRLRPERITARGFHDGAEHRGSLAQVYNQYARCGEDPIYAPAREGLQAIFRPLFVTSCVLADFLADNGFFGAERLLVSSASSKTAYGTAFCLRTEHGVAPTALTSVRNAGYVSALGCYGETALYDVLEALSADRPTAYVDFSGDSALRGRVHSYFGAHLVYDCFVGSTANPDFHAEAELPGPPRKFFFAPTQIRKRTVDWGAAELSRRLNAAQLAFFDHLDRADPPWIVVEEARGLEGAQHVVAALAAGTADPRIGHVVRLD